MVFEKTCFFKNHVFAKPCFCKPYVFFKESCCFAVHNFAESFFCSEVIEKFSKFGKLENEPLGKYLFSDPNITKHETYVATYSLGDDIYQGRKCIYDFAGTKFSVIEVFLFND